MPRFAVKRENRRKRFTFPIGFSIMRFSLHGGIAQLGERLHGMQEVSGSIPLTSTNNLKQYRVPIV